MHYWITVSSPLSNCITSKGSLQNSGGEIKTFPAKHPLCLWTHTTISCHRCTAENPTPRGTAAAGPGSSTRPQGLHMWWANLPECSGKDSVKTGFRAPPKVTGWQHTIFSETVERMHHSMIHFRTVVGSYQTFVIKGTVHSDRFGNLEPFISCDDGTFTR